MNFGDIAGGATDGTIVMSTAGNRSVTGGATLFPSGATVSSQGIFEVSGIPDQSINVQVTDATATLVESGGNTMDFTLTSAPSFTANIPSAGLGPLILNFGGILSLNADQPAGSYTTAADTYAIQVDYQ